jgi:hypothetical protein
LEFGGFLEDGELSLEPGDKVVSESDLSVRVSKVMFNSATNCFVLYRREINMSDSGSSMYVSRYYCDWAEGDLYGPSGTDGHSAESGHQYVCTANNAAYRWDGSAMVLIGSTLELGEDEGTAFAGDAGAVLKGRVETLETEAGAVGVLPFDGEYDENEDMSSGVWLRKVDGGMYMYTEESKPYGHDIADYNLVTARSQTCRKDRLYRNGNKLYTYTNNKLKEYGTSDDGNCTNVSVKYPKGSDVLNPYYNLSEAIAAVADAGEQKLGMQITFAIDAKQWKMYQYHGGSLEDSDFRNEENWDDMAGLGAGTEIFISVNYLCNDVDYDLTGAINAIKDLAESTGRPYIKSGLVFTYRTAERVKEIAVWATKRFMGDPSDFDTKNGTLFEDFGGGGSSAEITTSATPVEDGVDAFSTGGAYNEIPTHLNVDKDTPGVVKITMLNAKGEAVGDEIQFSVGTGSGVAGMTVEIFPESTPYYVKSGGEVLLRASVVVKQGSDIKTYNIEKVELYDRESQQLLETFKTNQRSSDGEDSFDFVFDLSAYFTKASTRKFKLMAYDDADHSGYRNLVVTAVDVTISAEKDLNYSAAQALQVGSSKAKAISLFKFENNASDKGITAIAEIYLNGEWRELSRETVMNTFTRSVSINPSSCLGEALTHGAYPLRIHGEEVSSGVVGNYLYTTIFVIEDGNSTPLVAVRYLADDVDNGIKQYETAQFEYAVFSGDSMTSASLYEIHGGEETLIKTDSISRSKTYSYSQKIQDVETDGSDYVEFCVRSAGDDEKRVRFHVTGTLIAIGAVTDQLELVMDMSSRSNSDTDKSIEYEEYSLVASNANYRTNGFVKDSFGTEEYGQANDTGVMSLRIAENMTAELDYAPFDDTYIESNGTAIQFKIKKQHIADSSAKLISCYNGSIGFWVDGDEFVFTCDGGKTTAHTLRHALKDGDVYDISLVIEPYSVAPYSGIGNCILYLNGEKAGACYYDRGTLIKHSLPVTFDGTYGDLYLYKVRAWRTYFNYEQAYNNALLWLDDTEEMISQYNRNNVMESQVAENTTRNRPSQSALDERGVNRVVICKNADTPDEEGFYPDYLEGLDGDKKTSRNLDWYHYWADKPWLNLIVWYDPTTNQGTTSSWRPDKNKKGKNKKARKVEMMYTREYVSETWPEHVSEYDAHAAMAEKGLIQIKENAVPQSIETIKVDYSESGGANNGAICEMYNDLTRALGSEYMTPAQNAYEGDYELNPAIASVPVALYRTDKYSPDATQPSYAYMHCKGNLNQDKGDAYVFGFEKVDGYNSKCLNYGDFYELVAGRDQSIADFLATQDKSTWEYVEKVTEQSDGTKVTKYWNVILVSEFCGPNYKIFRRADSTSEWKDTTGSMYFSEGKWVVTGDVLNPVDNFELKKYNDLCWFQGVNSVDDMIGTGSTPKWLDYYESRYPDDDNLNALYDAGKKLPYNLYRWLRFCQDCNQHLSETDGNITLGGKIFAGSADMRLKKWERELHTIANVKSVGCYVGVTDYCAAVDQRSKNMMVGFYLDTDGVVRMYLNHIYDGDTVWGSDNDCGLTIPWYLDPNNDAAGMYQGHDSVLFVQMAKAGDIWLNDDGSKTTTLKDIIKDMREAKRSDGLQPFSVEGCKKYWITDRLDKWPEIVSSYDGDRKYIEHSKSTANYYYALHGLGKERLEDYMEKRFEFRDGYYECGDLFKSAMAFRAVGENVTVRIKAAKAGFFGIGVDRANEATDSCYLEAGEEYTLKTGMTNTGSGTMLYVFGANRIGELDLSNSTPLSQGWNIGELTLLQKFIIGGEEYVGWSSGQETLANLNLGQLPFLKYLDVRNTKLVSINATYCPRLETVLAGGSTLSNITLAETSPIVDLQLPLGLTELSLLGLPKLVYYKSGQEEGLVLESAANVGKLRVESSPKVDAIQLLRDVLSVQSGSLVLTQLRIADMDVHGDGSELLEVIEKGVKGMNDTGGYNEKPVVSCSYLLTRIIDQEDVLAIEAGIDEIVLDLHINAFINAIDAVNGESYGGEEEVSDITLENLSDQLLYFNGETSEEAAERESSGDASLSEWITEE